MDPASLAAACLLQGQALASCPPPATPQASQASAAISSTSSLAARLNAPQALDALSRVVYAEAGNQGDSGLAAVAYTVINRLRSGRWGDTVEDVVNAANQFEPVMRAGGTWRALPAVTAAQEARVSTIVHLALDGRLPDLTGGAQYFQNRAIVAARAAAGQVAQSLVGFGGAAPTAQIGAHTFYASAGLSRRSARSSPPAQPTPGDIFFGENRAPSQAPDPLAGPAADAPGQAGGGQTVGASTAAAAPNSAQATLFFIPSPSNP